MRFLCKIAGHAWRSGYCRRCGATHKEHQWEQIPGKCVEKCTICGKESNIAHTWERIGCVSKCAVCGAEGEPHLWVNHQCSICGTYDKAVQDLFNASYVNTISDKKIQKILNSLNQETLTELAIKAKCAYACHAAKDRVVDTALLARIADESDNEYIVRELRKKFICPHCGATIDAATLALCKCHACGNEVHDFYKVEDTEIDMPDFTCGTRYEKCKRCGKETEHKEFSHYWEGH
ncbi:MAG TPA: hypothetical protein GXX36_15200 [Clostridiaceae bacterium]|nr:hypothetical protein [Clostridiaceae bacterium]